jgi:tRNA A37 threonylcarbamoyladenosine dehydratase
MLHPLISRNDDLKRLFDDGFEVEVIGAHLIIRSVPYVNVARQVRRGVLVAQLHLNVDVTTPPTRHVVMFAGEFPCDEHGAELVKLKHGNAKNAITEDLQTQYTFSNKPPGGYKDHYQLVTTYVANISGPAEVIDPNARAQTWKVLENNDPASVFLYPDTASSRAGITAVTRKLEGGPIAILGVGGSGAYALDLLAKTPTKEIHLFDGDRFGQHNAFRAPGAPSVAELKERRYKVDYFTSIYSRMRRGIVPHQFHIDATNVSLLEGMEFVFLCMDAGKAKLAVVEKLEELGIPFIDVGMGITVDENDSLHGILRVTTSTKEKRNHVRDNQRIDFTGDGENVYSQNIQIADLNALNAALAVLKWKKMRGFYGAIKNEHFSAFAIDVDAIVNDDFA